MSRRLLRVLVVAAIVVLGIGTPATAYDSIEELPEPTPAQLQRSVRTFKIRPAIQFSAKNTVTSFAEKTDDTWILATDILFKPDKFDLPEDASAKIADLLGDVPEGASLRVEGHTDSRQGAIPNQELSNKRAEALAHAITQEHPDLEIITTGHGPDQPAVTEKDGDESTFAANRRVEITIN